MTRPLIQIDEIGTVREMTEEEFANYEEAIANPDNVFLPDPE